VNCCCRPETYGAFFSKKSAERALKRYRRRGLDRLSEQVASVVTQRCVQGATILEVGGGIGALDVELLHAGAERAINVELSPEYEHAAAALASERGVEHQIERRVGDFVAEPDVPAADAVVMNRVVCCYPDYEGLVGAAADHARRLLVFTFPRERLLVRSAFRLMNLWLRLTGSQFRGFVHPPSAMLEVARLKGMRPIAERKGTFWQLAALERPT
jgi:hypothetical protein